MDGAKQATYNSCFSWSFETVLQSFKKGQLLVGLRTKKKNNDEGSDNCDRCCKLGAGDKIADVYHACKYRSIWIAIMVLSIQNRVLYVKLLTVLVKGSSMIIAVAIPVRIDEATRKLARYNRSSFIYS